MDADHDEFGIERDASAKTGLKTPHLAFYVVLHMLHTWRNGCRGHSLALCRFRYDRDTRGDS
jgi:hypothetical protein